MSTIIPGKTYILSKRKKNREISQIVHIDSIVPNNSIKVINTLNIIIPKISQKYFLPLEMWDHIIKYIYTPILYEYHYGLFGYHEGFCKAKNLRELNPEEKNLKDQGRYLELPNQFYHSLPSY